MAIESEGLPGRSARANVLHHAPAHEAIVQRTGEWTSLLQDLIRIPSCFEAEHDIVRYVCDYLDAIKVTPKLVPMHASALHSLAGSTEPLSRVAGRNNVVAILRGQGGGRSLIFNCHLDIQPEGDSREWTHPPFSGHIDAASNTIFGRGAMDDKAGVAICLGLLKIFTEHHPALSGDLIFHFVLEDEITGNGSLACLEAGYGADAAIILDGTRPDRALDQHAGNMEFHVACKGRAASVSVSHLGVNAAEVLSRTLLHLREMFFRLNAAREAPWIEFPSPYQFVIHGFNADAPRFSLPVEASARCFVTFPPPHSIADVRKMLTDEAARHAQANGYPEPLAFNWDGFAAEPVACASEPLREMVRQAAKRNGIPEIRIGPSTGTSDLRHFAARNIPCLLYGPGRGFNPHRPDEHFLLDDLPGMMKIYFDMALEWCNSPRR